MSRFTRRAGIALIAAVLMALSAGLPAARAVHAARPHASTVVQYWTNMCWEPARTYLFQMAHTFNTSHPGIEVKPVCFSNASVLQPRLLAAIQAHHPPALSQTDAFAVASYVDEGAVQDLTPYIHGPDGLSKAQQADFFPPMLLNGRYRGGLYSIPFNDTSVIVMWYNPKLLKAAGITTLPRTWTQFAADCAKVTKNGNWCFDTTDNEEPLWEAMVRQWGGQLVNVHGAHTTAAFDTPAGIGALQFFVNLVKKGYVHHTNSATVQWEQDFGSGHVAFDADSSSGAPELQQLIGHKFTLGATQLPGGPVNNDVGNGGDNLFMFAGATPAVKAAAWQYIKWVTSTQQTAWWAERVNTSPVRKSAVRMMAGYLKTSPTEMAVTQELPRAFFSPTVSGWAQAQGDIDTEMAKAMLGQETAAQAIANAAKLTNHDIATAP